MKDPVAIRELSARLVELQQPIRILDAIAWDDTVREAFFAGGCAAQPPVDASWYARKPLAFEPDDLRGGLIALERDAGRALGADHPAGKLLTRMCGDYRLVIELLEARGTPRFAALSAELYGRACDPLHPGQPSLVELADLLDDALEALDRSAFVEALARDIPADRAVAILQGRLDATLGAGEVHVRTDDGIVADAAAGSDYIKLRSDRTFSDRDLDVLEAHEGWVHVGTTLNGRSQPVCTFLGKGTPATTVTQEGLAVLVEIISLRSHPARLQRIADRIRAIHMAEQGATFLDVFRWLCEEGRPAPEAWTLTMRIFRGSLPDAGPFTKDLSYAHGFVDLYNFIRVAVRRGRADRIPLLFVGKIRLDEIGLLARLRDEGLLAPPRYLPPVFASPAGLMSWMACSSFFNRLDLARIEPDLDDLLA